MAKKAKKRLTNAQKVGIGVGLTAAAVAATGAYFLYGSKNAQKNRKKVKSWMLKAKADVLEALEKAEHITEDEYYALVDVIGGAYSKLQNATQGEISDFKREMKDHWKEIKRNGSAQKAFSAARKVTKKRPKKATKKSTKKTVKKSSRKTGKKTAKKTAKKSTKKASQKGARKR